MIPFDIREGTIWYNNKLKPWADVKLHVLSHGLHYASCVFEGERVYEGQVFALEQHTQRFFDSARDLDFEIPYTPEQIIQATIETIQDNRVYNGYVRPVAWRGSEMMGISAWQNTIHVAIAVWDWPSYFPTEAAEVGISLGTAQWRRPSPQTAPVFSKSSGLYMICTLSRHQAERNNFNDALMLDYRDQIAETTGANIFFVKEQKLHTPTADCFLNGITRQTVMKLAQRRNIPVIERSIWPSELSEFDEVFITGTAAEVTPVSRIDSREFRVGPITKLLRQDYLTLVYQKSPEKVVHET